MPGAIARGNDGFASRQSLHACLQVLYLLKTHVADRQLKDGTVIEPTHGCFIWRGGRLAPVSIDPRPILMKLYPQVEDDVSQA